MTVLLRRRSSRTSCRRSRASRRSSTAGRSPTSRTATTRSSPTGSALKLGDYVVTESGFGADMGMEKFFNIVCRAGGLTPNAVVLVATVKALKHHGGRPGRRAAERSRRGAREPRAALSDRARVRRQRGRRGQPLPRRHGRRGRARAPARARAGALRGRGQRGLRARAARARRRWPRRSSAAADEPRSFEFLYPLDAPIADKIEAIAKRVYGADGISPARDGARPDRALRRGGPRRLPICMAKTHLSLSHDASLPNAPDRLHRRRSATSAPTRAPAGSSRSAATCRRCRGSAPRRPRSTSTSTTRAGRSGFLLGAAAVERRVGKHHRRLDLALRDRPVGLQQRGLPLGRDELEAVAPVESGLPSRRRPRCRRACAARSGAADARAARRRRRAAGCRAGRTRGGSERPRPSAGRPSPRSARRRPRSPRTRRLRRSRARGCRPLSMYGSCQRSSGITPR